MSDGKANLVPFKCWTDDEEWTAWVNPAYVTAVTMAPYGVTVHVVNVCRPLERNKFEPPPSHDELVSLHRRTLQELGVKT